MSRPAALGADPPCRPCRRCCRLARLTTRRRWRLRVHSARPRRGTPVEGVTRGPLRAKFEPVDSSIALFVLRRLRLAGGATLAALALFGAGAQAAPVGLDSALAAPDPYELAARWTLASVSPAGVGAPLSALQPIPAPAGVGRPTLPPGLRHTGLPLASGEARVPDPVGYALMGLALLVAGLLVQRLRQRRDRRPRRGMPA